MNSNSPKGSVIMVAPIRPIRLAVNPIPKLSRRKSQTLKCLLRGLSEKQIAKELGLSQHTIHIYVKELHKQFGVASRGELLARWISNPDDQPVSQSVPTEHDSGSGCSESLASLIARRACLVLELAQVDLKLLAAAHQIERLQQITEERLMSLSQQQLEAAQGCTSTNRFR
jgi:DNA-binding CsgD family transcriptional regulator